MRAILVDDELPMLEELRQLLEDHGSLEIVGAYTEPLEALNEISTTRPDCAFLDIEMAGMNGIDVAKKLLEKKPGIKIVFITAYNNYAAQAFDVSARDYILKPVRPEHIRKAIDKLCRKQKEPVNQHESRLRIQSFGHFEVYIDNKPLKWSRSKTKELFAYLLQHAGQRVSKFKLCDDLWTEYSLEQALANLQTSIWALRKNLKEVGYSQIKIEFAEDRYILNAGELDWDLLQFEKLYEAFAESSSVESAKKAVALFKGGYAADEDWLWAEVFRQNLELRINHLAKNLAEELSRKERYPEAVELLWDVVKRSPSDERAMLLLLEVSEQVGGYSRLKGQYIQLMEFFEQEIGVELPRKIIAFFNRKHNENCKI